MLFLPAPLLTVLAQQLLTEADAATIHERLNQQETEIERLRNELAQYMRRGNCLLPCLPIRRGSAPTCSSTWRLLRPVQKKGLKSQPEKKEEKKEPEWVDMSADKWTVKLGGHVQGDQILWPNKDPAITVPWHATTSNSAVCV